MDEAGNGNSSKTGKPESGSQLVALVFWWFSRIFPRIVVVAVRWCFKRKKTDQTNCVFLYDKQNKTKQKLCFVFLLLVSTFLSFATTPFGSLWTLDFCARNFLQRKTWQQQQHPYCHSKHGSPLPCGWFLGIVWYFSTRCCSVQWILPILTFWPCGIVYLQRFLPKF